MKVTTYLIASKARRQLVKDGWMKRPPMTFTHDRVNLGEFLSEAVKALQQDPNFNVRRAIHTAFSKCPRYLLTDTKKRLFGIERELDNAFEVDITDLFLTTLENQVRSLDSDADHLAKTFNEAIEQTEAFEGAKLQLIRMGYE